MRLEGNMQARSSLLLALFIIFSIFAAPQQSPTQSPASTPQASRGISIDVVVTNKSGKAIPGLQQQDFALLDDKQTQPIVSFQAFDGTGTSSPPQQAIFLIDAVNTGYQSVEFERQQLQKYLQQNASGLPLPTSLVVLSDASAQIQPVPTRDAKALMQALDNNQTGLRSIGRAQGFYGGVERVQLSLDTLGRLAAYEKSQPGRKLLIWLSPGWPLLSGPEVQLSKKAQQGIFNTIVALSASLREARMSVYSIDPLGMADAATGRTVYYKSFVKGVTSPGRVDNGDLGLQVIATQTGGQVLNSSNDLTSLMSQCLEDAKAYYTISFTSPPADGPNEYHNLQIKIDKPGLTARTRTGYYAQP